MKDFQNLTKKIFKRKSKTANWGVSKSLSSFARLLNIQLSLWFLKKVVLITKDDDDDENTVWPESKNGLLFIHQTVLRIFLVTQAIFLWLCQMDTTTGASWVTKFILLQCLPYTYIAHSLTQTIFSTHSQQNITQNFAKPIG